ncbi:MAG: tetratricopeptide repeat protein, partial [Patescibacteria group bacterium]|nr:tetratricopeptide repeat protein [Patescibacteria group bacterium]
MKAIVRPNVSPDRRARGARRARVVLKKGEFMRCAGPNCRVLLLAVSVVLLVGTLGAAAELLMRDGRTIEGRLAQVASLAGIPQPHSAEGEGPVNLIVLTDDDLRRTFVPRWQIQSVRQAPPAGAEDEKFLIRQRVLRQGSTVRTVGPTMNVTPFDEFGRRILQMNTRQGPLDVVQGITELTPRWAKVEGITHVWDMRIATSSIPSSVLKGILQKQIDPGSVDHQKKAARFYLQAERFVEARQALEAVLATAPDNAELQAQLDPSIRALRQMGAQRLLRELQLRRDAGQHRMVRERLETFPSEDVAGEILQAVRELLDEYATASQEGEGVLGQLELLASKVSEPQTRANIEPACVELRAELSINTLARMAAFRQHADDEQLLPEQRLALAISGWLIGSDSATLN